MEQTLSLRGLTTVSIYAADHAAAVRWYAELLGTDPYYNVPGYSEFRLGDYQHELGIVDKKFYTLPDTGHPGGAIIYWHVDDLDKSLQTLLDKGAQLLRPVTDHSNGKGDFVTAPVIDPFGNILGIMFNRHFVEMAKGNRSSWKPTEANP